MRSLTLKLTLAFLIVTLTGTVLVAVFAVATTTNRFNQFVADQNEEILVSRLADYYQATGGWSGINLAIFQATRGGYRGPRPAGPTGGPPESGPLMVINNSGRVIVPGLGHKLGDEVSRAEWRRSTPIEVDGQEVGRLLLARDDFVRIPAGPEAIFLNSVNRALILGSIGATAVAVLLGVLLARTLTRPLRELTTATRSVAQGDLSQKVPVRSEDELGELAASFNQMSADLAQSRDLRRQLTADVAHDLRTPLSVILGHSEALSEGVLPPSSETFHVIHDEARRLSLLVEDLRTLTLAEAGELRLTRRPVATQALIERAVAAYSPRAQHQDVTLEVAASPDLPEVNADPDRIAQVLDNLLSNALRYTPAGGRITLAARGAEDKVQLVVQDSGPGIPAEELPYIFERFYRGNKSRQRREEGGSGLGLAIAKSIVEAHNGRIWAESAPGQGVTFITELPVSKGDQPAV